MQDTCITRLLYKVIADDVTAQDNALFLAINPSSGLACTTCSHHMFAPAKRPSLTVLSVLALALAASSQSLNQGNQVVLIGRNVLKKNRNVDGLKSLHQAPLALVIRAGTDCEERRHGARGGAAGRGGGGGHQNHCDTNLQEVSTATSRAIRHHPASRATNWFGDIDWQVRQALIAVYKGLSPRRACLYTSTGTDMSGESEVRVEQRDSVEQDVVSDVPLAEPMEEPW